MTTIRELQAADALSEASTDGFWEEVTFYPGGGPSRTIRVNLGLQTQREDAGPIHREIRTVKVVVFKDEDGDAGGIAAPYKAVREADAFTRAGETARYVFTGRVFSETPHSWLLEFQAPAGQRTGTDHIR